MKRHLSLLLALLSMSILAQALDLTPSTRLRLRQQAPASRAEGDPDPYQPLMLVVAADSVVDQLIDLDVVIYNGRSDILLTSIPRERLDTVLSLPGILNAEASGDMSACMDKARPFGLVNVAQQMTDVDGAFFDGTGQIVAFADVGFDNKHIAFRDRVLALYDYDAAKNYVRKAVTPLQLSRWDTDDTNAWHATHVANILAGAYRGAPYYGVAPGAKIVGATSRLTDVGILAGVEDVIAYAKEHGRRPVINMSLGNSLGPHDGTSLFCQYLSLCADDAVFCISAGNTGQTQGFAYKDFTNDVDITRVLVNSLVTWNGFNVDGMTEFWSMSADPFDFRIEVFDMDTYDIVYATPWVSGTQPYEMTIDTDDHEWAKYFSSGAVTMASGISPLNGRYNVAVAYNTATEPVAAASDGRWSRYYTCLAIKGSEFAPDAHVDIFADSHRSMIGKATNATSPIFSYDGSISDFCTARGIISVGACSSRNTAPSLYDTEQSWPFNIDNVASFSSYSTRSNMPRLPHFAAPGNYVVSAISNYYMIEHDNANSYLAAVSRVDDNYYYWATQCGTSMSSPYAAGVIALWLQANPSLTVDQIIDIAQSTALTDYPDISDPRWGAGCINAKAGLERVIASIPTIIDDPSAPLRIYTITGTQVPVSTNLAPGIYIVDAPGQAPRKVIIH